MSQNNEKTNGSEERFEALKERKISSTEILRIDKLKRNVHENLLNNGDIFTQKDRERWLKQIETAKDVTTEEIESIARQIDHEKSEIKNMTGNFIARVNQDKQFFGSIKKTNKSESDQWIESFKKKPVETKREWLKGLEEKIGELKELYDKAKKLAPDNMEEFAGMDRNEKAAFLRERESLRQESAIFREIIEKNKILFNREETEKFNNSFNDLTANEQGIFLSAFEKNEIRPRTEIHDKYESFPTEYRQNCANFNSLNLIEKKIAVDQIEKDFINDYQSRLFTSALSKHLSLGSKIQALKWFMEAPNKQRGRALKLLDSQMKVEEELSGQFEDLIKIMDSKEDENKIHELRGKFYGSKFEDKQKMIKTLDQELKSAAGEKKGNKELTAEYETLLNEQFGNKTISAKTAQREIARFKKLPLNEKAEAKGKFINNIAPRAKLKERFEKEISTSLQKENADFYELGHKERMERFDTLKKLADNKEQTGKKEQGGEKKELSPEQKKKILELQVQATTHELNSGLQEALNCYSAILMIDNEDPLAKERIQIVQAKIDNKKIPSGQEGQNELKKTIESEFNSDEIKKKRKDQTIIKGFSKAVNQNDLLNSQKTRAGEKTAHLSEEEAQIQAELYRRTGMVLDNKGRAAKIIKADLNNFEDLNHGEKYELQKNVREKGSDHNINFLNNNFQITQSGEVISGSRAMETGEKKAKKLQKQIEERIAAGLKAKGKDLTAGEKELLAKLIAEQDLTIDLQN